MNIKTRKGSEIYIPNWLLVIGLITADNVYANRCKTRSYKSMLEKASSNIKKGNES